MTVTDGRGRPVRDAGLARWLAAVSPVRTRGEVAIALVGDEHIRRLNYRYRGKDAATDVLSFPPSRASRDRDSARQAPPSRASRDRASARQAPPSRVSKDRATARQAPPSRASRDRTSARQAPPSRASRDRASARQAPPSRASRDRATARQAPPSRASKGRATARPAANAEPRIPSREPRFWGDIVIASGVARRQARRVGHPYGTELRVLALHGLLHLLGYDHDSPGDRGRMARAEARLRRKGGLREGLIERPRASQR